MAGWAASGSRPVRGACGLATPGSAGTMGAGALTCTGCWDCAGCWCAPASAAATWPRTCWAGPHGRSATTSSVSTAIAPGCWRRLSTRPHTPGRACARPTGFGWVRPAARAPGPHARGAGNAQGSVYVRLGTGVRARLAVPVGGHCAAGGGRWARRRVLGGPRVRRGAAGRRAPERAPGPERATYGTVPAARHHRRHQWSARLGQGTLPADRPTRRQRGDGRPHPRAASRAHAAPDARARDGAVHPGRHPSELHPARPDAGAGGHRVEPDRRRGPRPAPAYDAGGRPRRGGAGRAAGRLRRARAPQPRRERQAEAARGADVVPLGRGAARLGAGGRAAARNPRGVHDGPRGRLPRPVPRAPRARPAGRPAGPREGRPRRGHGEDARRADGLAPSVRRGAQRAGPRRRHGRGAAAQRAGEGQQTGPQGPPGGARRRGDTALPARGAALPRGPRRSSCGSSMCASNSRRPRPSRWSGSC